MEVFEKYWEKEIGEVTSQNDLEKTVRDYNERRTGWRAAFKTIRDKFNVAGIDMIITFIDKELENGNEGTEKSN
jgi:hypothetical protein